MFVTVQLQCNCDHLVDTDFFKSIFKPGDRLEGARVFARLFGILDDELFQSSPDPFKVNLALYDIYESEWILLYGFLRNGFIPSYTESKINTCYEVSLKLGGIPSFDTYLQSITPMYNPMSPIEDTKQEYVWDIHNISSSILPTTKSVTIPYEHDCRYVYVRCKLVYEM